MNGQQEQPRIAFGWIILLVILYIIFNPIPGPIDDAAVAAVADTMLSKDRSSLK
ncbi:MAG: hypothetical protein ACLQPD_31360 [Desulfomonilaceae bacterium]